MDLTERLTTRANVGGAAGFGVCLATPFTDERQDMERRIAAGTHAGLTFTYGNPAEATDVRTNFPWAQTLAVVAWSYVPDAGSPGAAAPGTGRIARFATEDHYRGLRALLDDLAAALTAEGFRAEALSDDNRLVDRAAAVRAGVGWWGKNAMVLAPGQGPWLLLGSVVTDAPLRVSTPMVRDCGTCAACLPACPTGALTAPGILDARKCLARWAQAAGVIPREYREPMGDRIYGCDDCLEACPPGSRLLDAVSTTQGRVDLLALLASPDRELLARYGHFYLPRRRPSILRRNALVALGNEAPPDAVGVLAGYLGHADPMLRLHAAWALGRLQTQASDAVLRRAASTERDGDVRAEIDHALR